MSNPSKAKGTGGENEAVAVLELTFGREFARTKQGEAWDAHTIEGNEPWLKVGQPVNVLMTRPDYGRWLITVPPEDLRRAFEPGVTIRAEVKRYARFALHTIYAKKFGGKG